jgi:uncharacterized repeat protein (TIGR02543 family)
MKRLFITPRYLYSIINVILFGLTLFGCGTDNNGSTTIYTVSFNSNGGTVVSSIVGISSGATIELPISPTKENHTFAGWFFDNETFQNQFTATTPVTGNITIYAKWESIVPNTDPKSLKITDITGLTMVTGCALSSEGNDSSWIAGCSFSNYQNETTLTFQLKTAVSPNGGGFTETNWSGNGSYYVLIYADNKIYSCPDKVPFNKVVTEISFTKFEQMVID